MKNSLTVLREKIKGADAMGVCSGSYVLALLGDLERELNELNWAERADAIHWGHLEKLRKEIVGEDKKK